jgi:hypothetical protein
MSKFKDIKESLMSFLDTKDLKRKDVGALKKEYNDKVTNFVESLNDITNILKMEKNVLNDDIQKIISYMENNLNYYYDDVYLKSLFSDVLSNLKKDIGKNFTVVKPSAQGSLFDKTVEKIKKTDKEYSTEKLKRSIEPLVTKLNSGNEEDVGEAKKEIKNSKDPLLKYAFFLRQEIVLNNLFNKLETEGNDFFYFYNKYNELLDQLSKVDFNNDKTLKSYFEKEKTKLDDLWKNVLIELITQINEVNKANSLEELERIENMMKETDNKVLVEFCVAKANYQYYSKFQKLRDKTDTKGKTISKQDQAKKLIKEKPKNYNTNDRSRIKCGNSATNKLTLYKFLTNDLDLTEEEEKFDLQRENIVNNVLNKIKEKNYRIENSILPDIKLEIKNFIREKYTDEDLKNIIIDNTFIISVLNNLKENDNIKNKIIELTGVNINNLRKDIFKKYNLSRNKDTPNSSNEIKDLMKTVLLKGDSMQSSIKEIISSLNKNKLVVPNRGEIKISEKNK